jgi:hypothetical protein
MKSGLVGVSLLGSPEGVVYAGAYYGSPIIFRSVFPRASKEFACGTGYRPFLAAYGMNFVTANDAYILSCHEGQTAPMELFSGGLVYLNALGVGATHAYWVPPGTDKPIVRCSLTGCSNSPETFAASPTGASRIFVTADAVYARLGDNIGKFAISNAAYADLGTIAGPGEFIVRDDTLYAATPTGISTCPISGCGAGPTPWVAQPSVSSIYPDASRVYWRSEGDVYSCAKGATCLERRHELTGLGSRLFAADDSYLWIGGERQSDGSMQPLERILK